MSETYTMPHIPERRTRFPFKWTIMTDPDFFRAELREVLGNAPTIANRLAEDGYTVDPKTVNRWLSGESDIGLTIISRLLRMMEAEHARRADRARAFFGEG